MYLVLAEPKLLRDSINIISDLVNEVKFKVNKNSLELIAMDPANVAMVVFKLLGSAFAKYDVEDEEEIAINLSNFRQILRRAKPTDSITIELEQKKNRLKIELKGESTRTFSLSLLNIEEEEQKIPNLEFPHEIEVNASVLAEAIEDMGVVAESVYFLANKDNFVIKSEGSLSTAKVELNANEETLIKASEEIEAKYSIGYLKNMVKASRLAERVKIKFNKNYPLRLDYNITDRMQLSFILAPRVENI